jgi:hypothetical protein
MGREATCHCKWGDEQGDCKVLLEPTELIFRHGIRRRVLLSALTDMAAVGENLVFHAGRDRVQLRLGPEVAQRWLKAMKTPPPSLARKLGISPTTKLLVLGDVQSEELTAAIAQAGSLAGKEVDLTLICVDSERALSQCFEGGTCSAPLWIVYPKGPDSSLKESAVRELLRSRGFIDTKVASVSAKLTALRFARR